MKVTIFKTGTHTSAQGKVKTYTQADLERMVELYNEQRSDEHHEAPAVIGHPKDNGPAYGWVEKLEVVGNRLIADIKECATEFTEWLEAGFYKKVSPSFYADGKLRHVGFLGAQPPAVKGLPGFEFADGDELETYEFSDYRVTDMTGLFRRLREWIITDKGIEAAEQVLPAEILDRLASEPYDETQWLRQEIAELRGIVNTLTDNSPRTSYSENEPMNGNAKGGATGADDGKQPGANVPDDYAELQSKVDRLDKLATDQAKLIDDQNKVIAALEARNQEADFREFLASDEMKSRLTPGNRSIAMAMLKSAAKVEGELEYAEGDATKTGSALDAMKAELRTWPVAVDFSESATKDRAAGGAKRESGSTFEYGERDGADEERSELAAKVRQLMKERNVADFSEALDIVLKEGI